MSRRRRTGRDAHSDQASDRRTSGHPEALALEPQAGPGTAGARALRPIREPHPDGQPSWTRVASAALALAAITWFVYAPVLHYDFVALDDPIYILDNPQVRGGLTWPGVAWAFTNASYANFWHPMTWLSLMLDVQLFGLNAGPMHVTNVILHMMSTLLLFAAMLRMSGALWRSAVVAALFAVHPLHVESVAWIAERKDVLSTLFWMLTLCAYVWYARNPRWFRYLLALVFFGLGLMAKSMLVTLPFTLLLLDMWPLGRVNRVGSGPGPSGWRSAVRAWMPLVREKIPFFALAASAGVVAVVAQRAGGAVAELQAFPLAGRLANALIAYVAYLARTIWPASLVPFYPYPPSIAVWSALGALIVLAGVSFFALRMIARWPFLAVGWFWYLGTLLPVIGLVQVGSHAMADRYTYVPLIGLFVMIAWGVPAALGRRQDRDAVLAALSGCAIVACGVTARAQVSTWKNTYALWQHAVEVTPANYFAHNALGLELVRQGRTSEAMSHFVESARLASGSPNPHNNMGLILAGEGRLDEAIEEYKRALAIAPAYPQAHVNLGNLLARTGRAEDAIAQFRETLRLNPESIAARVNLGAVLADLGRYPEAMLQYNEALRLQPGSAEAHRNLANALQRIGRFDQAATHYWEALRLGANPADVRRGLGATLVRQGRFAEAMVQLEESLRLSPGVAETYNALGIALASQRRPLEAVERYQEAIRLKPDYREAHMNLGSALFDLGRLEDAAREHAVAIRLDAGFADAHYNLAETLQRMGRLPEAVAEYQATLRLEGGSADVYVALGLAQERLGRADEASASFEAALRLEPDSAAARAALVRAGTRSGKRR